MIKFIITLSLVQFAFAVNIPKTIKVNTPIEFKDDLDFENMNLAIDRQLESFSKLSLSTQIKFANTIYKRSDLKESLIEFKSLISAYQICKKANKNNCATIFSNEVNSKFNIYQPVPLKGERGFETKQSFFTAYYSPDFEASFTKTQKFKYPIYKKPSSSKLASSTREQIDFEGKFEGKNLEIAYVDSNYYDLWLLHVEGGGRIKVKNTAGKYDYYYLSYDGTNGKSFKMLSDYMLANKMITPENRSVLAQRAYTLRHPEDVRKIMSSSPSYIYFKITKSEPLGVRNIPLTEKRSLATDKRKYKVYGILNFIQSKKAKKIDDENLEFVDYSRFYISQDTGGGIRGNARSDLYFGYGEEAALNANSIATLGNQYFLVLKPKD